MDQMKSERDSALSGKQGAESELETNQEENAVSTHTVEPPNNGHVGDECFVIIRRLSLLRRF